ncbi:hypothetical protein R80B4_00839 [Fibrobacteres bacterium R8-0-B4]
MDENILMLKINPIICFLILHFGKLNAPQILIQTVF